MNDSMEYHNPVLLKQSVDGLNINPEAAYVDVTYGGGGHSREILRRLNSGRLLAFDQDKDAIANAIDDERFILINQNFKYLKNYLKMMKSIPVQGILADLGVSSFQFDTPSRGFSFRFDAALDMRMDAEGDLTAEKVLNQYEEEQLANVFYQYGEFRNSRKIARKIVASRAQSPLKTTHQLSTVLEKVFPPKSFKKDLVLVFQALRIEVNQEMEVLKSFLKQSLEVLDKGGRLVVISYHSLEDRLVKNFIKAGNFEGVVEKDFFGVAQSPFKAIGKLLVPSDEEIEQNSRARSAKLRIAEKL